MSDNKSYIRFFLITILFGFALRSMYLYNDFLTTTFLVVLAISVYSNEQ